MEKPVALQVQKSKSQKRGGKQPSSDSKTCVIYYDDTHGQTINSLTEQGFLRSRKLQNLGLISQIQNIGKHVFHKISLMYLMKLFMVRTCAATTKDSQIPIS